MDEAEYPSNPQASAGELEQYQDRSTSARQFNVPLAYLRTLIIVLVVAYHAAMAYNASLPPPPAASLSEHLSSWHAISPVNDAQRSDMLSLFAAFNDTFMMSLLFFLSGLFVWGSLQRKGNARFLRDRLVRLGIPLVAMVILRPLTYIPTYWQAGGTGGLSDFWHQWSAIEWRGGPIWFLEVLLLYSVVFVLVASLKLDVSSRALKVFADLPPRPVKSFLVVILLSALAYIPVTALYGSVYWLQVGPAQIQVNRLFLYAVYFLAGVFLGAYGINRSFLVSESSLARRWALWIVAALVVFVAYIILAVGSESEVLRGLFYVLSCAAISFAFLAMFFRFAKKRRRAFDSLFECSYGIYIIHYGVVSFLLFAMLDVQLPAMAKFLIVFAGALAISWGATAALRRIPLVARVI